MMVVIQEATTDVTSLTILEDTADLMANIVQMNLEGKIFITKLFKLYYYDTCAIYLVKILATLHRAVFAELLEFCINRIKSSLLSIDTTIRIQNTITKITNTNTLMLVVVNTLVIETDSVPMLVLVVEVVPVLVLDQVQVLVSALVLAVHLHSVLVSQPLVDSVLQLPKKLEALLVYTITETTAL